MAIKRRSGPSGPSQTREQRLAAGRRLLTVWISVEAYERLEQICELTDSTKKDAIELLIDDAAKKRHIV